MLTVAPCEPAGQVPIGGSSAAIRMPPGKATAPARPAPARSRARRETSWIRTCMRSSLVRLVRSAPETAVGVGGGGSVLLLFVVNGRATVGRGAFFLGYRAPCFPAFDHSQAVVR